MRKWLILFGLLFIAAVIYEPAGGGGIYNNSGTVSADSIVIPFYSLTVDGEPETLDTNNSPLTDDSIWVRFMYPDGSEAYDHTICMCDRDRVFEHPVAGGSMYFFTEAVANIDGSGVDGVYAYHIVAENRGAGNTTPTVGTFQLYQRQDFDAVLNSIMNSTFFNGGGPYALPLKQVIWPHDGSYNKDSVTLVRSPFGDGDTVATIIYIRDVAGAAVDEITLTIHGTPY